jgi:hypothetical protein
MPMTNSEKQWIARAMHTISYMAFVESSYYVVWRGQKSGEDVLEVTPTSNRENAQTDWATISTV